MHEQMQQFWFNCWNADNERARDAYDELRERESKPRQPRPELEAEICRRYLAGESIEMVSRSIGCGFGLVRAALDRNDVQMRSLSEAATKRWGRVA